MTEHTEADARRIAGRGRDALLEQLRPAFEETAREHSGLLTLDAGRIEEILQRAADRADGLQWRRALAAIATEELGMGLGEALGSPVVARAQELAGAPSYEAALADLGLEPVRSGSPNRDVPPAPQATAGQPEPEADAGPPAPGGDDAGGGQAQLLRLTAIHLGGIATLDAGERNLELQIGAHGVDIARQAGRVLGRLRRLDIRAMEAQQPRTRKRRRRRDRPHLIIRTRHGDATFEVLGVTEAELQASLATVLEG